MPPIHKESRPELYEYVKDRNLQGQWFLLETLVQHSLRVENYSFTPESLFALHHAAANLLERLPGCIRNEPREIEGSKHKPPHEAEVQKYLTEFFRFLNDHFDRYPIAKIGAYALWRITWIHPFIECNGRTARAFSYLVMCKKLGRWLPGTHTLHELIRKNSDGYYRGLELADKHFAENGTVNVDFLEEYIKRLLYSQLSSGN